MVDSKVRIAYSYVDYRDIEQAITVGSDVSICNFFKSQEIFGD